MDKIEVRRMNGEVWVKLNKDLAVVPICLLDQIREEWANPLLTPLPKGRL